MVTLRHITPDQGEGGARESGAARQRGSCHGKGLILSGFRRRRPPERRLGIDANATCCSGGATRPEQVRHAAPCRPGDGGAHGVRRPSPRPEGGAWDRLFTMTGSPADHWPARHKRSRCWMRNRQRHRSPRNSAPQRRSFVMNCASPTRSAHIEERSKKLLPDLVVASAPEATAPPTAAFQPLSLGMMGGTSEAPASASAPPGSAPDRELADRMPSRWPDPHAWS